MRKTIISVFMVLLLVSSIATAQDGTIPADIEDLAFAGVESNSEWEPYIQEFNGVEMVLVPAGCFMMGSTEAQLELVRPEGASPTLFDDELPAHKVCFEEPFWIDRYEVTNALYQEFVDAGGYDDPQYWTDAALRWMEYNIDYTEPANYGFNGPQQPRVGISWFSANAYALWRGCRIPTEAEWEYAARGPDSLIYPWGNEFVVGNADFWELENHLDQPVAVGRYPDGASWVGAQDMSGNVWEWVNSLYEPYPYDARDGREDMDPPEDIGDGFDQRPRAVRGGAYTMGFSFLHVTVRYGNTPGNIAPDFGFRCAMEVEAPAHGNN